MNTEETIAQLKALKRYEITKYKSTATKEVLEYEVNQEYGRFVLAGEVRSLIRGLEAADSPAGTATPKESVICVEALEKEGWERMAKSYRYTKGSIRVYVFDGIVKVEIITPLGHEVTCKGVSSMQDLRTLELLVNGQK